MNTTCNTRFCIRFVCSVSVAGIGFLNGCVSSTQYCGVNYSNTTRRVYSDNYDLSKGILPRPSKPAPVVVTPYTTRDLEDNPFYCPPQPPLGCISYDNVRN